MGSKTVDFIALGNTYVLLLEVKDFWGYERENVWRITGEPKHARMLEVH